MYTQIQIAINFLDLSGGLFEETNSVEEIAFKYAVDHINRSTFLCFLGCQDFLSELSKSAKQC